MGLNDSEGSVPSLACRGLGMQRSVKSQALTLHRGPIVLHSQSIANPHKARAFCCLCLFHAAGFLLLRLFLPFIRFMSAGDFRRMICLWKASVFPISAQPLSAEAVFSLSTHPTLLSNPSWLQSHHIRPCLTAPKQEAATLDSLSYYLGHRPAMPLTLCHVACSHYKPSGSRGPPACILSVCVYTSTCVSVCGFNPSFFPTGFWKHFVHLLMLCVSALRPRRSHFYLLSRLTADGMTGSRRKRFVSS